MSCIWKYLENTKHEGKVVMKVIFNQSRVEEHNSLKFEVFLNLMFIYFSRIARFKFLEGSFQH